ncbi:GNAT family N-acetyltransferase [Fulvivirga maritima]|uniref:GNAT family N-acetyltransferase n=1 Tax=Fulvivirga maritima TaxID=2904247 RepID=UPI001F172C62|nr:GNAT family N-acetyltransferase [Fulvivirga maritima]UII29525.1 GNAT family N-acetyltransferase [Fulvivirga maritima]
MIQYNILRPANTVGLIQREEVANFLFKHLDQYGDPKEDISKAIDYALNTGVTPGGFVVTARKDGKVIGAVVVNRTGMKGYIPENILVYIAMDRDYRGQGIGKELMNKAIAHAEGAIALHVEPDNPAKILYEKLGFTNKYLEMRLQK